MYYVKILLVLSVILLTACTKNIDVYTDGAKFKEEYEALNSSGITVELNNEAKIKYLELTEVLNLFENKTGIIYFGFPSCPWCRNIIPVLLEVANDNNEVVYYFNPKEVRGTDNADFAKLMEILDSYLNTDENGEKVLYVPDVYFIKNGKIVGHHLGSASSQTNPYEKLTDEQTKELKETYVNLINKIK